MTQPDPTPPEPAVIEPEDIVALWHQDALTDEEAIALLAHQKETTNA